MTGRGKAGSVEAGAAAAERVTVLWFPDFPVYAVGLARGWDMLRPAATIADYRVQACNAAARAQGVRQGMKQRHALATCPELRHAPADPVQEATIHEDIVAALMEVAAGVETLRPGLVALPTRPLANYYGGGGAAAVELLLDSAARLGVECLAGTADDLMPAVWAARRGVHVPPGRNSSFVPTLPIGFLAVEAVLSAPAELVSTLQELGVRSLRDFAALGRKHVAGRFGAEAVYWHRVACGEPGREVSPQRPAQPVEVLHQVEEPIRSTETAAFVARQAAARLHGELFRRGEACLRLTVRVHLNPPAEYTGPTVVERAWRCREPLTEEDTAQRVRWQLDGWITRLRAKVGEPEQEGFEDSAAGVVAIELLPVETVPAGTIAEPLWGGADEGLRAARAAAGRAQALIGMAAVQQVVHRGGRAIGGRVLTLPYGEEVPEEISAQPTTQWRGELPAPLPATVGEAANPSAGHPAASIAVLGERAQPVHVTGRGLMSEPPQRLRWGNRTLPIRGWAGPWPVDEQWWAEGKRYARLQVATDEGAYLLVCKGQKWRIEATY